MPVVQSRKIIELAQASNPKLALINAVGDLSKDEVCEDLVLVATYFRPEKTKGGIIRPTENIREDEYQGKVGLVLKMGPEATGGKIEIKVGDWIVYTVHDAPAFSYNEVPCRLLPYSRIRMKISDPQKVF